MGFESQICSGIILGTIILLKNKTFKNKKIEKYMKINFNKPIQDKKFINKYKNIKENYQLEDLFEDGESVYAKHYNNMWANAKISSYDKSNKVWDINWESTSECNTGEQPVQPGCSGKGWACNYLGQKCRNYVCCENNKTQNTIKYCGRDNPYC